MKRSCGILLHLSSLPGKYGIGTMGREAYQFIDRLKSAGQRYWQILPLNPTGFGDSPYQGTSVFAGNPYFIDYDILVKQGRLSKKDLPAAPEENPGYVDYRYQEQTKYKTLKKAFQNSQELHEKEYIDFKEKEAFWLNDYALFMALKEYFNGKPHWDWEEQIRTRRKAALLKYAKLLSEQIEFHCYIQYLFAKQWAALKEYANKQGVYIIGDIPFYVSADSADAWANPDLFDKDGRIAGCPPDAFAPEGQLWGNPVYNFDRMAQDRFWWWRMRFERAMNLYDLIRVDHFRGFEAYYAITAEAENAVNGQWIQGPAEHFFDTVENELGCKLPIIAEDLGFLTEGVFALLRHCGYPGTKVLQFAFDKSRESIYLPYRYDNNCVVYTGTHDNNTSLGWYRLLTKAEKTFFGEYVAAKAGENAAQTMIRLAYASVADLAIIPMQDILSLPESARMNTPATVGGNWQWRLLDGQFDSACARWLKKLARTYGR